MKIRWINESQKGDRENYGHWRSVEGRFAIEPRYRSTVYPSHYQVSDLLTRYRFTTVGTRGETERIFDTVRECKQWAESRVNKS